MTRADHGVTLLCTVRGCAGPLVDEGPRLFCPRGHAFDRARSGYVNLLQPHDRRSLSPGDSKEAAAARRRLLAAGHEASILAEIVATVRGIGLGAGAAVLDVGCGEGFALEALASELTATGVGLDISVPAIDLAARAHPGRTWVVANADRYLPFAAGSFDLVTSITSRRNAAEMHRVTRDCGWLVVVLPGAADLAELRTLLHGQATAPSRVARNVEALAQQFELLKLATARCVARLDRAGLLDLLAATYRGGRRAERERIAALEGLEVTLERDILLFERR